MSRRDRRPTPQDARRARPAESRSFARWSWVTAFVIAVYLLGAGFCASVTPFLAEGSFINAPDEPAHLGYVRALAVGHRLPVRDDAAGRTYQWHQPPGYYGLASLVYPAGDRAVRWLSIVLGLASGLVVLRTARRLYPGEPAVAALALAGALLVPMRMAVHASAGNDAQTELVFSLAFALLVETTLTDPRRSVTLALGGVLAAGLWTKASATLLAPLLWVGAAISGWSDRRWGGRVVAAAAATAIALVLFAPWALRNLRLYGEVTPVRAFAREFEGTSRAADWIGKQSIAVDLASGDLVPSVEPMTRGGYLSLLGAWTFRTFWAAWTPMRLAAIGKPVFLSPGFYALCALLCASATVGLFATVRGRHSLDPPVRRALLLLVVGVVAVAGSFAAFTWVYFQAQGRYLYPALLPLAILQAVGLCRLGGAVRREAVALGAIALLVVMCAAFVVGGIAPAYGAGQ